MMSLFSKRVEPTPRTMWAVLFGNTLLCVLAIIFFMAQSARSATPNPGHSASEIDFPVTTVTTTVTLARTQTVVLADATTAAFTITLPSAVTTTPYTIFYIKKIDAALANLITIDGNGAETIDGATSITLSQRNQAVYLQADGAAWRVISRTGYGINAFRSKGATLNQWYTSPNNSVALTTGAPSANNLRAMPFIVEKTMTIDQMAINVTTALGGGTTVRVGIYNDNGNNYPGTLIVDAGTQAGTPAGVKTYTTGLPVTLQPGLYWLAYFTNNAVTIRAHSVNTLNPVLGYASTLPTNPQYGWSVALAFAALPATFTGGGAPITAAPIPAVYVRVSQ